MFDAGRADSSTAVLLIDLYRGRGAPGKALQILSWLNLTTQFTGSEGQTVYNSTVLAMFARVYTDSRQYKEAFKAIKASLKLEPDNPANQALSLALEIATGSIERLPENTPPLGRLERRLIIERADHLWEQGEGELAIGLLQGLVDAKSDNLAIIGLLAHRYRSKGRLQDVQILRKQLLERFKDNEKARTLIESLLTPVESDPKKALAIALKETEKEPDLVVRYLRMAGYCSVYNELDLADTYLRKAEEAGPKDPRVVYNLFNHSLRRRDLEAAKKYAKLAGELDLDKVGGRFYRARVAATAKDWDEAIRLGLEAAEQDKTSDAIRVFLGGCYLGAKQYDEAKKAYEQVYEENPANFKALLGLLSIANRDPDRKKFQDYLRIAYGLNPKHPVVREAYLRTVGAKEHPQQAIRHREDIRKRNPGDLKNLVALAELYELQGQMIKAGPIYKDMAAAPGAGIAEFQLRLRFLRRANRDPEAQRILAAYVEKAKGKDKVTAYLIWGGHFMESGKPGRAKDAYEMASKLDPADSRAYAALARMHFSKREMAKAVEQQRECIRRLGDQAGPHHYAVLIEYLIGAEDYAGASKKIEEALAKGKGVAQAQMLVLKGSMLHKQNKYEQALGVLDTAVEMDSSNSSALLRRAKVHMAMGARLKAEADLEAARVNKAGIGVVLALASIYDAQNEFVKAHGVLARYISESPLEPKAKHRMVALCLRHKKMQALRVAINDAKKYLPYDPAFLRAEAKYWLGVRPPNATRAMTALMSAKQLVPGDPETKLMILRVKILSGDFDGAVTYGKALSQSSDTAVKAMALLGWAYKNRGEDDLAERTLVAALKAASTDDDIIIAYECITLAYKGTAGELKLDRWIAARPDDWRVLFHAGRVAYGAKSMAQAVKYYKGASDKAKKNEDRVPILKGLGAAYMASKQYKLSAKAHTDVLAIKPNDVPTLNNLAFMLAEDMKQPAKALAYGKKAYELWSDNAHIADTYGYVLFLNEQYIEAQKILTRSIDIEKMPVNLLHRGKTLEKRNLTDEAYEDYRDGWEKVKRTPDHNNYRELREAYKRLGGQP